MCRERGTELVLDDFVYFLQRNLHMTALEALQIFKKKKFGKKTAQVKLTSKTAGIASQVSCTCASCAHQFNTKREVINWGEKKTRKNSNVSFATNVLFCMALQQIGGGRIEADILTSFLNLPNGSSMAASTMMKIENKLGVLMRNLCEDQMREAICEEVKAKLVEEGRPDDYVKWKNREKIKKVS